MSRQIVTGIDIGTEEIKVIIAEGVVHNGQFIPKVIGTGTAESRGVERGFIKDPAETSESLRIALNKAEKGSGVKVKRAYVSFGGVGLGSLISYGSTSITRADLEITENDIASALESAEKNISKDQSVNKKILNTIPIEYKIDNERSWGEPIGLKAQKLEVKALFITCLEHHLTHLIKAVEESGVEVIDVVAGPVATSFVTISKKQQRVGSILADIGAETLSVIVFENNNPVSLEVFPVGGSDITNDIALGLKVSLEEAETIKLGGLSRGPYSKKKYDEIVSARLYDCFELIEKHLKKIGRNSLLPAGIILSGGTSNLPTLKLSAENNLNLPATIAEVHFGNAEKSKIKENTWATACGLVLLGFNAGNEDGEIGKKIGVMHVIDHEKIIKKFSKWFSQFLP